MVDPFQSDSLFTGKDVKNRKMLIMIFVPIIVFALFAVSAFLISIVAIRRIRFHPECACKKIMEENPPCDKNKNIVLPAAKDIIELSTTPTVVNSLS